MFSLARKFLFSTVLIGIVVLIVLLSGAYMLLMPTKPEMSITQQRLIERLDSSVGAWLDQLEATHHSAVFLTFNRDPHAYVSEKLRDVVWRSDCFDLLDYSMYEKISKKLKWTRPMASSRRDAVKIASRRNADYVIWGTVERFSDTASPATLVVDMEVVEVANGNLIAKNQFELEEEPGFMALRSNYTGNDQGFFNYSLLTGLLLWIGFTLLLPLLAYPLIKNVVLGDSNAAILAMLISAVFASVFVCYIVLVREANPWLGAVVLLFAFAIALFYYYKAFDTIKTTNE